jgi:hypothetical protein
VTINVNAPPPTGVDAAIDVIVHGPTSAKKDAKKVVAKVTNVGT